MKKLLLVSLALAINCVVRAGNAINMPGMSMPATTPEASWRVLDQQVKDMAIAVQAKNTHPLHEIDHAVTDEIGEMQKTELSLLAAQKQKFDSLLTDMAKQATRAHHDGHASDWDDAAAAQKQFADDVKQVEALLPSKK